MKGQSVQYLWFVRRAGVISEDLSTDELLSWIDAGEILRDDEIRRGDLREWCPAHRLGELLEDAGLDNTQQERAGVSAIALAAGLIGVVATLAGLGWWWSARDGGRASEIEYAAEGPSAKAQGEELEDMALGHYPKAASAPVVVPSQESAPVVAESETITSEDEPLARPMVNASPGPAPIFGIGPQTDRVLLLHLPAMELHTLMRLGTSLQLVKDSDESPWLTMLKDFSAARSVRSKFLSAGVEELFLIVDGDWTVASGVPVTVAFRHIPDDELADLEHRLEAGGHRDLLANWSPVQRDGWTFLPPDGRELIESALPTLPGFLNALRSSREAKPSTCVVSVFHLKPTVMGTFLDGFVELALSGRTGLTRAMQDARIAVTRLDASDPPGIEQHFYMRDAQQAEALRSEFERFVNRVGGGTGLFALATAALFDLRVERDVVELRLTASQLARIFSGQQSVAAPDTAYPVPDESVWYLLVHAGKNRQSTYDLLDRVETLGLHGQSVRTSGRMAPDQAVIAQEFEIEQPGSSEALTLIVDRRGRVTVSSGYQRPCILDAFDAEGQLIAILRVAGAGDDPALSLMEGRIEIESYWREALESKQELTAQLRQTDRSNRTLVSKIRKELDLIELRAGWFKRTHGDCGEALDQVFRDQRLARVVRQADLGTCLQELESPPSRNQFPFAGIWITTDGIAVAVYQSDDGAIVGKYNKGIFSAATKDGGLVTQWQEVDGARGTAHWVIGNDGLTARIRRRAERPADPELARKYANSWPWSNEARAVRVDLRPLADLVTVGALDHSGIWKHEHNPDLNVPLDRQLDGGAYRWRRGGVPFVAYPAGNRIVVLGGAQVSELAFDRSGPGTRVTPLSGHMGDTWCHE